MLQGSVTALAVVLNVVLFRSKIFKGKKKNEDPSDSEK